jgi:hypothetical protein
MRASEILRPISKEIRPFTEGLIKMNSGLKISLLVLISLFLAIGFWTPTSFANTGSFSLLSTSSVAQPSVYSVNHETYFSVYAAQNTTARNITTTNILYVSAGVTYANSSFIFPQSPESQVQIKPNGRVLVYILSSIGGPSISGTANITLKENGEFSVSSPAQLVEVVVNQNGTSQEVWSGYLGSEGNVNGFAYYNPKVAGSVTLEYADGYNTENFTVGLSAGASTAATSIFGVSPLKTTANYTETAAFTVPLQFPRRYHPTDSQFNLTQYDVSKYLNLASNSSNFSFFVHVSKNNASASYLNGTMYPALVWRLSGYIAGNSTFGGKNTSASIPFDAMASAFYGVNGTHAGYIGSFYAGGIITSTTLSGVGKLNFAVSSTTTVVGKNVEPAGSLQTQSYLKLNNSSVLLFLTTKGEVESTANVTYSKTVYLQSNGSLVELQVNATSQYYAIFSNGSSGNVSQVAPSSETNSTFTVNGTEHVAKQITVNGTGYILINATLSGSYSGALQVYKQTSQGTVELNAQDYTVSNGYIQIFDDPSSTYYVVYPQTISNSNAWLYLAIIAIVAMLAGSVIAIRKRKKSTSSA